MRTHEKIEIIESQYIEPYKVAMIGLIVGSSFLVASIPIFLGMKTNINHTTQGSELVVPSEATLWNVVK